MSRIDAEALARETWDRIKRESGSEITVRVILREIASTINEVIRIKNELAVQTVTKKTEEHLEDVTTTLYGS